MGTAGPSYEEELRRLKNIKEYLAEKRELSKIRHEELRKQYDIEAQKRIQYYKDFQRQSRMNYQKDRLRKMNDLNSRLAGLDINKINRNLNYLEQFNESLGLSPLDLDLDYNFEDLDY